MLLCVQPLQLFCLSLVFLFLGSASGSPVRPVIADSRLSHARELLGSSFKKKVIRKNRGLEVEVEVSDFVLETTKALLPKTKGDLPKKLPMRFLMRQRSFPLIRFF